MENFSSSPTLGFQLNRNFPAQEDKFPAASKNFYMGKIPAVVKNFQLW